jgi:hypothetical protein
MLQASTEMIVFLAIMLHKAPGKTFDESLVLLENEIIFFF